MHNASVDSLENNVIFIMEFANHFCSVRSVSYSKSELERITHVQKVNREFCRSVVINARHVQIAAVQKLYVGLPARVKSHSNREGECLFPVNSK